MKTNKQHAVSMEDVCEMFNTILRVDSDQRALNSELIDLNRQQEDLLHEIEFSEANSRELAKLGRKLRDIRRARRITKNALELLGPVADWRKDNQNAFNRLSQAIGKMRAIDQQHNEAFYKMRSEDRLGEVIEHAN